MEPLDVRVTPSLLDRLTDHAPSSRSESPPTRSQGVRTMKAALWRDLTALLNTKRCEQEVAEQYGEISRSLLNYGLPDFTSFSLKSPVDQNKIRRALESAIRRFEPRLEKVTVSLNSPNDTDSALQFRVDAFLRVEPAPEPVSFEAVLQSDTGQILVVGDGR